MQRCCQVSHCCGAMLPVLGRIAHHIQLRWCQDYIWRPLAVWTSCGKIVYKEVSIIQAIQDICAPGMCGQHRHCGVVDMVGRCYDIALVQASEC